LGTRPKVSKRLKNFKA